MLPCLTFILTDDKYNYFYILLEKLDILTLSSRQVIFYKPNYKASI